jgi:hypothetical protein
MNRLAYFQAHICHSFENTFELHRWLNGLRCRICSTVTKSSLRYGCIHLDTNNHAAFHCLWWWAYMLWYRISFRCRVKDSLYISEGLEICFFPFFWWKRFVTLFLIIWKCKWFLGLCLKTIQVLRSNSFFLLGCSCRSIDIYDKIDYINHRETLSWYERSGVKLQICPYWLIGSTIWSCKTWLFYCLKGHWGLDDCGLDDYSVEDFIKALCFLAALFDPWICTSSLGWTHW